MKDFQKRRRLDKDKIFQGLLLLFVKLTGGYTLYTEYIFTLKNVQINNLRLVVSYC